MSDINGVRTVRVHETHPRLAAFACFGGAKPTSKMNVSCVLVIDDEPDVKGRVWTMSMDHPDDEGFHKPNRLYSRGSYSLVYAQRLAPWRGWKARYEGADFPNQVKQHHGPRAGSLL